MAPIVVLNQRILMLLGQVVAACFLSVLMYLSNFCVNLGTGGLVCMAWYVRTGID